MVLLSVILEQAKQNQGNINQINDSLGWASGGESINCKDKNVYIVIGVGSVKSGNFYVGKLFLIKVGFL